MKKLSKTQWQKRIIEAAQNLPKDIRPDDATLMQILVDVIVSEQSRLKPQNLASLVGISSSLLVRVKESFPAATHMTQSGQQVYSEADIATHLGVSIDEVRTISAKIAKEFPEEAIMTIDPDLLHRIN
jgi:AraC-like DNA-binding protein